MERINYAAWHKKIKGGDFYSLCNNHCAGMCERYYLSYYLPREDEYIAAKLGMDLKTFQKKYVTVLKFKDGSNIHLLKISSPCPFLDSKFRCLLEKKDVKLIACKIYPFCLGWQRGKKHIYLDYNCVLAWNKKLPEKFLRQVKKTLQKIKLPKKYLQNLNKLGTYYDYYKLDKLKRKQEITYAELQKCLLP